MKLKFTGVSIVFLCIAFCVNAQIKNKEIFKSKYVKEVMYNAAKWQSEHRLTDKRHDLYDWTYAAYYIGVSAAYKETKDKMYWNEILLICISFFYSCSVTVKILLLSTDFYISQTQIVR